MPMTRAALATALTIAATFAGQAGAQEARVVAMGTGDIAGVYFPVGIAVCRLVNRTRREHGVRCAATTSAGSVANIEALRSGGIDLAIVQSDVQSAAVTGSEGFADAGAWSGLRSVMALYPESLTLIARADSGISAVGDLAGRRFARGAPGSGQRQLVDDLVIASGWTADVFAETPDPASSNRADALCADRIDAFALVTGHPSLAVQEVTNACAATLVPVTGPAADALVAREDYYAKAVIPGGLYRGVPRDVPTFGVTATLVTRDDVPDEVIDLLVRSVFDDVETLRGLNPVLANLVPKEMTAAGLSAPLHPAAEAYFRERGLIE